MISYIVIIFFFFCHLVYGDNLPNSVVSISITIQNFDHYSPWQKETPKKSMISGCVIEGNRILTIAFPLANHILIEVSKHGEPRQYPAEVIMKDYNYGLALLTVNDKSFFADLEPVEYAEGGRFKEIALVAKWDEHGFLKKFRAEAFKTSIDLFELQGGTLAHQMTTGLDSGGKGEPVFIDDKLLGITYSFDDEKKIVKVFAIEAIKRMLADLDDGSYQGYPFFWANCINLESDENLRDFLGLDPDDTGILLTEIPPTTSGYNILKEGDVILSIDGINIDDRGLYESANYGKLDYFGIIGLNHFVGDTIRMTIIRDKKRRKVSFELLPITQDCFLIPLLTFDSPPQYYIIVGLIFQELSKSYLMETWGSDWYHKADIRFVFHYNNLWFRPTLKRKRVVILNRVLPASENVGYHDKDNLILLRVNGKFVRDLKHLKELVEKTETKFLKFDFQGGDSIILEEKDLIEKTTNSILKNYNISSSFYIEG